MKIAFLGAARTVTGSCFLVTTENNKFLVDCGMFQGKNKEVMLNVDSFTFEPASVDYVFLTHAHIDHSGRIPKLYNDGFKGKIITTHATTDLCRVMLPDSGHIQEMETQWINKKRARAGKEPIEPLYTAEDAINCMELFDPVRYGEIIQVNEYIKVRFNDAGHMLGSAIIEIWVKEGDKETKAVFTGDLGNMDTPILRDPSVIDSADMLVMESTYGDRNHLQKSNDKFDMFLDIVNETLDKGGNVVIPSFAVGRTQEIVYGINTNRDKYGAKYEKIKDIPVYVDSPLAISATEIYRQNEDCYDDEAREYILNGENPVDFPNLRFSRTVEDSKAINESNEASIIISASGMCEAGRIRHHLKHHLWRPECTILFVGYQAQGTLGRRLINGEKQVRIFGEDITVNARIEYIEGFSGHADQQGLQGWFRAIEHKPKNVFIVHGEASAQDAFAELLREEFGVNTIVPERGDEFVVDAEERVSQTAQEDAERKYRFMCLEILDKMDLLRDEVDEMYILVKEDLRFGMDNESFEELKKKLRGVEKSIIKVLE